MGTWSNSILILSGPGLCPHIYTHIHRERRLALHTVCVCQCSLLCGRWCKLLGLAMHAVGPVHCPETVSESTRITTTRTNPKKANLIKLLVFQSVSYARWLVENSRQPRRYLKSLRLPLSFPFPLRTQPDKKNNSSYPSFSATANIISNVVLEQLKHKGSLVVRTSQHGAKLV
jgi:hypothetical protein